MTEAAIVATLAELPPKFDEASAKKTLPMIATVSGDTAPDHGKRATRSL
ncbi:hypothetical protein ABIB06_007462 [Bradyrhizobium sp. LB8.2]